MTNHNNTGKRAPRPSAGTRREKAESQLGNIPEDAAVLDNLAPEEIQALIHELRVHQVELEAQNEELCRAQGGLEAARYRYQQLYELSPGAYVTLDRNGSIEHTNLTAAALLGEARSALIGKPLAHYANQEDADILALFFRRLRILKGREQCEVRMAKADGGVFVAQVEAVSVEGSEGRAGQIWTIIRDISERKALERRLIDESTIEQERIGRDIHDGLAQQLTVLTTLATSLKRKLADAHSSEAEAAGKLAQHLQKALDVAKALSSGLAPVEIDSAGLGIALKGLVDSVEASSRIACHADVLQPVPTLDGRAATHLYWIAQEAINNAAKHAQPQNIFVELRTVGKDTILSIRDDGKGVNSGVKQEGKLGMHIMRYRADIVGARLRIVSTAGNGTLVQCTLSGADK